MTAVSKGIAAKEIITRIKLGLGIEWLEKTADFIKAGDESTIITGIATTVWSTLDVLEKAVARGKNLVVTHESTFWAEEDRSDAFPGNALAARKQDFIDEHRVVVFRFHDHWHLRQPD